MALRDILDKIIRVFIFAALVFTSLTFLSSQELARENIIRLTAIITVVFIIYEMYFPCVKI